MPVCEPLWAGCRFPQRLACPVFFLLFGIPLASAWNAYSKENLAMDRLDVHVNAASAESAESPARVHPPIQLTPNARVVLEKRYLRRGLDGRPVETPEEMFDRIAGTVAAPDTRYNVDAALTRARFYELLTTLRFFPNSPTFTGAGTPLGQLAACFVLPIRDDMGRDPAGIFSTLRD